MSSHIKYDSVEEAQKALASFGYKSIDNKFWYIPNTHRWAYIIDSKAFFFFNEKKNNSRVARIVSPSARIIKNRKELEYGQ